MFNVRPDTHVPGFNVRPETDVPGFRVTPPALVPGPGGDGSGSGWDRCTLIPGTYQFGFCLYRCPDGTVRRLHGIGKLGCPPSIFRNDGLGL
jgi:hypothetical protein